MSAPVSTTEISTPATLRRSRPVVIPSARTKKAGQQRILDRRHARLIRKLRAGDGVGPAVVADRRTQLLGDGERRKPGRLERGQKQSRVVVIGTRQRDEVLIVHRDLDTARVRFLTFPEERDGQRRQQGHNQDDGGEARLWLEILHEARVFDCRRSRPA